MFKVIFLLALVACQEPIEALREQGRPEPIKCVATAEYQETCVDGKHVVWVCKTGGRKAKCIVTGVLPAEIP